MRLRLWLRFRLDDVGYALRRLWTAWRPVCSAAWCGRARSADATYCARHEAADLHWGPVWARRRGLKRLPPIHGGS